MDHKYNQIVLNGSNYPTWKIQCKMALMKDGLWGFVNGMERIPDSSDADGTQKYNCLLYTSPSPRDPKTSRMPSSA